jgi:ABC-type transport system involved in cytochrome c biogenesis permease subunit
MLHNVEVVCFAASYTVALALEFTRLWFRSGVRGMVMLGFALAGLLAHTLFLFQRYTVHATPLSSAFDWYLMAAWGLVVVYLYLTYYHPKNPIGVFILPIVLALIGVAEFLADRASFSATQASRWWGAMHGAFLLLGAIAVILAFVAGVMYLIQARRLKHKRPPPRNFQLPSLEWLARFNTRAILLSVVMLVIGVVAGIVLNAVNHGRQVDQLPWTDPVVLTTTLTVAWLLVAVAFGVVYKPARQGRKVAYLTLASFLFLAVSLGVSLLVNTRHGGGDKTAAPPARALLQEGHG